MLLKARLAVITGSNRGIGRAILECFAAQGADIVACARRPDAGFEALLDETARRHGISITPCYFDLRDAAQVKEAARSILAARRPIDVLVNNAGIAAGAFYHMQSIDDMRDLLQVNLLGPLLFTQSLSKYMVRHKAGSIINMASVAGLDADAGMTSYGASKAALIQATRTLATELGAANVRVNAIAPSVTRTDMFEQMEAKARERLVERSALRRAAEPGEVAQVALFLASDMASFVTGQVLRVDGGML